MPTLLLKFLLIILGSNAQAQWLCRETTSIRTGHIITACGVGQSQILEEARVKSRESAIEEFKRVCQLSSDCINYDYVVVPKRTDCEQKNGQYICYRALDFEISETKRKSVSLDLSDLEQELKKKNNEINDIQDRIEKINQIKQSEDETASKKQQLAELEASLNKTEAEALKLQDLNSKETIESGGYRYLHQVYTSSIKISLHYWSSKISSESESDVMWILAYEKRPYSWLGLQIYGGFVRGYLSNQKSNKNDVPPMGTPNSTFTYNGNVNYADMGISILMYSGWRGIYLKGELGQLSGRKESFDVSYNGAGVGTIQTSNERITKRYTGIQIGFDTRMDKKGWGAFFEVGARQTTEQEHVGSMGAIGLNYGF